MIRIITIIVITATLCYSGAKLRDLGEQHIESYRNARVLP